MQNREGKHERDVKNKRGVEKKRGKERESMSASNCQKALESVRQRVGKSAAKQKGRVH